MSTAPLPCAQHPPCPPPDALDYSLRSQSDLDDQHDYDSVASDEDTDQELLRNASRNNRARVSRGPGLDPHPDPRLWDPRAELLSLQSMDSSDLSDGPITLQEYLEVKKALAASEAKVQQLMKVNNSLSDELRRLQREVGVGLAGLPSSPYPLLLADAFPLLPAADPQAAGREHADPAADRSCASHPGPQRAAGARAPPRHGPPTPPGPPGLLHVRAGLGAETLRAACGGAGDTAPALQPWRECAGLGGRVLGCSCPPSATGCWVLSPRGRNLSCVARRWRTRLCTPCTSRPACTG